MFYKALVAGLLATTLSACLGDVTINSNTVVVKTPSKEQERHPRGEPTYSCTDVDAIYDLLENGDVTRGCGYRLMTAYSYRDDFYTFEGERFRIIQFQIDFITYYGFEETYRRHRW
jgi:hypothetical protein